MCSSTMTVPLLHNGPEEKLGGKFGKNVGAGGMPCIDCGDYSCCWYVSGTEICLGPLPDVVIVSLSPVQYCKEFRRTNFGNRTIDVWQTSHALRAITYV